MHVTIFIGSISWSQLGKLSFNLVISILNSVKSIFGSIHSIFDFANLNFGVSIFVTFDAPYTWKLYGAFDYYTYPMTALLLEIFLLWFGVACELWLASYSHEKVPQDPRKSFLAFHWLLCMYPKHGTKSGHNTTNECVPYNQRWFLGHLLNRLDQQRMLFCIYSLCADNILRGQ